MEDKQNLSGQEEIYRLLHEKSGIGIAFYKLDGTVISYNQVAATNMGGKPEDFKGKSIYDLFPKQEAALYHGRIKEAASSHQSLIFEDKLLLPIGEVFFLSTFTKIEDEQGALVGIQIISQDITAQKQLEEENLKQHLAISKLNQVSIELLKLSQEEKVEQLITKRIKEISGAEAVIFCDYHPVEKTTSILHIDTKPGLLEKVVELLGKPIHSIKTPISDEVYAEAISERIGIRKTLYEVSLGAISRPISKAIQAILKVDRFIGLAYVLDGKLYGSSVLGMAKDTEDPSKEILENFISMASLSIRRKQIEEKLKESEERYRRMFQGNHAPMLLIDPTNTAIMDANPAACDYYGWNHEELIKMRMNEISSVSTEDIKTEMLLALKESKNHFYCQHRLKDGSIRDVEIYCGPLYLGGKELLFSIILDITERKIVEKLAEKEKYLNHTIIDSVPGAFYMLDEKGRYVRWNAYQRDEIVGKPENSMPDTFAIDTIHPEDRDLISSRISNVLTQGVHETVEGRVLLCGGPANRWLLMTGQRVVIEDKPYLLGIGTDITDRKQAEEEIKQLNETLEQKVQQRTKELEESNQALEAFSHSISHDLRAPLRAINGFSQILVERYQDILGTEPTRLIKIVVDNTNRMNEIINGMLSISKISSTEIKMTFIDMTEMVHSVYQELVVQADKDRISFTVPMLENGYGDRILIHQVWVNLIENAVKFSRNKEKPSIQIQSYVENNQTVYKIKDNGTGFDPEYQHKLFQMFQRLHSIEDFQGTGIGLALIHRIIQRHSGQVWAEGIEGEGATFYFSLPICQEDLS